VTFFTGENHERSLAGEFIRVLRDAGAEVSCATAESRQKASLMRVSGAEGDGPIPDDDQEEG